jgi:hypothetical protein
LTGKQLALLFRKLKDNLREGFCEGQNWLMELLEVKCKLKLRVGREENMWTQPQKHVLTKPIMGSRFPLWGGGAQQAMLVKLSLLVAWIGGHFFHRGQKR